VTDVLLNPGPTNTRFQTKLSQWLGSDICHRTSGFREVLSETQSLLLERFGEKHGFHIALFGGSGTLAMEAMISSLITDPITIINAGTYGERAMEIMKVYDIPYSEIKSSSINDLSSDEDIKKLYFVENETTTGEKFPLSKVAHLFPNASFFIDSTSAFGASDYSSFFSRIEALSFCSNKCLQSTPGLGCVIWRKTLDIISRNYYGDLSKYISDTIPFTLPVQVVSALNKTLKISFCGEELFDWRSKRLISAVTPLGIECINECPSNSIIGFKHPSMDYPALESFLKSQGVIIYSGIPEVKNSFRLSTMSVLFDKKFFKIIKALKLSCK
jgi:2-aminoethylphosphonate-pyruvate transaminase